MFETFYDVRVVEDGKVVLHKEHISGKDRLLRFVKDKTRRGRRVIIRTRRKFTLTTFQNTAWLQDSHDWVKAPTPISKVYIHHSVTKQLEPTATVDEEREQMRLLDQIAHGRGFNGFSYCWAVFPSGRAWEGRGFGIVEAGTLGHNTDGDSIVLVGNYSVFKPSEAQLLALRALINRGQRDGFFTAKVDCIPHRRSGGEPTSCPGDNMTDAMVEQIQKAVNA